MIEPCPTCDGAQPSCPEAQPGGFHGPRRPERCRHDMRPEWCAACGTGSTTPDSNTDNEEDS